MKIPNHRVKTKEPGRTITGEISAEAIAERHQSYLDEAPAVARCAEPGCERWLFKGTAAECRDRAAVHRAELHPGVAESRRRDRDRAAKAAAVAEKDAKKRAARPAAEQPVPEPESIPPAPEPEPPVPPPAPRESQAERRARARASGSVSASAARYPVTADEAIAALRAVAGELGRTPSSSDWNGAHRKPSLPVYYRLFGNWAEACAAAGLPPREARPKKPGEVREAPAPPPPMEPVARVADHQPVPLAVRADAVLTAARVDPVGVLPGTLAEVGGEIIRLRAQAAWLRARAAAHEEAAAGLERLRAELAA